MNLSISNIAWGANFDDAIYNLMEKYKFNGLEIAPTRLFPDNPYEHLVEAHNWAHNLQKVYGISLSSIQSIWYGKTENMFNSSEEEDILYQYTKKAIDFAQCIGAKNIVFGCPKNRNIPDGKNIMSVVLFFRQLGEYAIKHNTILSLEANPPIYNTNFINTTQQAIAIIKEVNSDGFRLNLDIGTMIENDEHVSILEGNFQYINHVHISEPLLKTIVKRDIHKDLAKLLKLHNYKGFVSIEMGKQERIENIDRACQYIKEVFA